MYENAIKKYPQVHLEQCKYKIKKTKMCKFTNTDIESESESVSELEFDTETKPKSDVESDSEQL